MMYYIIAGAFGFMGLTVLLISIYLSKSNKSFQAGRRIGKAEVVGRDYAEGSAWPTSLVKLIGVNHEGMFTLHSDNYQRDGQLPNGTILDVEYAPKQILGHTYYEVYLLGSRASNTKNPGRATMVISVLLFVAALAFLIVGIIVGK